jgi:hypothetical protein
MAGRTASVALALVARRSVFNTEQETDDVPDMVEGMTALHSSASIWEYRSLYRYLQNRFADTVVLTFAEIEGLLGFALPDLARLRKDWWANPEADAVPSSQSRSWIEASRTAAPNLLAQSVTFERVSN